MVSDHEHLETTHYDCTCTIYFTNTHKVNYKHSKNQLCETPSRSIHKVNYGFKRGLCATPQIIGTCGTCTWRWSKTIATWIALASTGIFLAANKVLIQFVYQKAWILPMDARNTSSQPVKSLIKIRRIEQLTEKARQLQIKIQPHDLNIGKTKL